MASVNIASLVGKTHTKPSVAYVCNHVHEVQNYYRKVNSTRLTGTHYHVSQKTILDLFHKYGIPMLPPKRIKHSGKSAMINAQIHNVFNYYRSTLSLVRTANKFGVSTDTIRQCFKKYHLPTNLGAHKVSAVKTNSNDELTLQIEHLVKQKIDNKVQPYKSEIKKLKAENKALKKNGNNSHILNNVKHFMQNL